MKKIIMMDDKITITQFWQLIWKYSAWIFWVMLGLVGRFSYDLIRNKKFTNSYVIGCTGISLLVGYVGGIYVFEHYPLNAPILIPSLTLLGNNIVSFFMSVNWEALLRKDWKGAFEVLNRKK